MGDLTLLAWRRTIGEVTSCDSELWGPWSTLVTSIISLGILAGLEDGERE